MPTRHLKITGNVQGVFFRATAAEKAAEIGVTGWIKNTVDGNVEAIVTGKESQLDAFITWCHEGPKKAKVEAVAVTDVPEKVFDGFRILRG